MLNSSAIGNITNQGFIVSHIPPNLNDNGPITKTYALSTAHNSFPKKEQVNIIESKDEITIKDYVIAMSKIIKFSDIIFISRISNGRISMSLSSKGIANKLTEQYKSVSVKNNLVRLRSLISKLKRFIISNV